VLDLEYIDELRNCFKTLRKSSLFIYFIGVGQAVLNDYAQGGKLQGGTYVQLVIYKGQGEQLAREHDYYEKQAISSYLLLTEDIIWLLVKHCVMILRFCKMRLGKHL